MKQYRTQFSSWHKLTGCSVLLFCCLSAHAANFTWTGAGANNNWTTAANWGGTAPTGLATDNLTFAGATRLTPVNNFPANTNFGTITFSAANFTISGNAITANGTISSTAANNTINLAAIALGPGSGAFNTSNSTVFTINSQITGTRAVSFTGGIDDYLALTNATNNFTGTLTVSGLNFMPANDGCMGNAANSLVITALGGLVASASFTTARNMLLNSGLWIFAFDNQTLEWDGIISDGGTGQALNVGWRPYNGNVGLRGNNTYGGVTSVNRGNLILENNAPVSAAGAAGNDNSAIIVGGSNGNTGAVNTGLLINGAFTVARAITVSNANGGASVVTLGGMSAASSVFSGAVALQQNVVLTDVANGDCTFSGVISGGFAVTKTDVGEVVLSGAAANTYTGTTTVSAGTLIAAKNAAMGTNAAGTTVANNAALGFQGGINYATAEAVTINGTGTAGEGSLYNVSGTNTFAGAVTLASASTIGSADAAGLLTLSGGIVNGGFLVTTTGPGDTTESGVVSGNGGLTINQTVSGTLTLSGAAANTYTGLTTVSTGTLIAAKNSAMGTNASGTTVANNAALGFQGGINYATAEPVTINGTGTAGEGSLYNVSGANTFAGVVTLATASTIGSTVAANLLTLSGGIVNGGNLVTTTGAGDITESGVISGIGGLTVNGTGNVTLSGAAANTFSGTTNVTNGVLLLNKSVANGAIVGPLIIGNLVGTDTVRLLANDQIGDLVPITANLGAILDLNNHNETIGSLAGLAGSNIVLGNGGANTFSVGADNTSTSFAGGLAGTDTTDVFNKVGTGTLTLTGANTYAATTTVSAGILNVQNANALGTTASGTTVAAGAALQIQGGITITGEALTLNGTGIAASNKGALESVSGGNTFTGAVTLASASSIGSSLAANLLTISGGIVNGGFLLTTSGPGDINESGVVSGTGGLTVNQATATGTLTLSGAAANTYSGVTTVTAGTLIAAKNAAMGTNAAGTVVANNASLAFTGGINYATAEAVTINGTGTAAQGSLYNLSGTNTFAGAVTLATASTIGSADAAGLLTLSGGIVNGGTLVTTIGPGDITESGVISGTGGLTVNQTTATGVLTLSGAAANTYTGTTTVSSGTLIAAKDAAMGTTAAGTVVANNASLGFSGGINYATAEPVTLNGAGTAAQGSLYNVSGANTFAGAVTLASASTIGSSVAANLLTLSGGIVNGGNLVTTTGAGDITESGVISGIGGLTVNGTGNVTLSGAAANTFSGTTDVTNGVLLLNKSVANGAIVGPLIIGNLVGTDTVRLLANDQIGDLVPITANLGAILDLNNHNETIGSLAGLTGSNIVLGNGGANTFSVGADNTSTSFAGGLAGTDTTDVFNKVGTGTLTLTGPSTYAALTTVSAGILNVQNATALGSTASGTTVVSGAALQIQGGITITGEALTLNGTGIAASNKGALESVSGGNTFTGPVTLASASSIGSSLAANLLTISGGIVNGGFLLTTSGPGDINESGVVSGIGGLTVNQTVTGTTTLSGAAANTYSGATTVTAGTLIAAKDAAMGTIAAGTVVANNASLAFTGGINYATAEAVTINGTGTAAQGSLYNLSGTNTFAGAVTLASASTIGSSVAGNLLTLSGGMVNGGFLATTVGPGNITESGIVSGTGGLTVNQTTATGTLTLSGAAANTYSGTTTVSSGTLIAAKDAAMGTVAAGTVVSNNASLGFSGGINYATAEPVTLNGAGTAAQGSLYNVSGANTFAGAVTLASASTIGSSVAANLLTLSAGITNGGFLLTTTGAGDITESGVVGGVGGLTLGGTGNVTLSGAAANTFSGTTSVNGGVLLLNKTVANGAIVGPLIIGDNIGTDTVRLLASDQIADTAAITTNLGGVLDLNNKNETIGSLAGLTGASILFGNGAANTFTVGANNTSTTFAGGLAGADTTDSFVKVGTGTLTLSGPNTYAAATTVSVGILNVQDAAALGTTASGTSVASGATLQIQGGISIGAEALTLNGVGVGSNGALESVAGVNSIAGAVSLATASFVGADAGSTLTLGGIVSGAAGIKLSKVGTGTLILTGANTYAGDTGVSAGILNIQNNTALGAVTSGVNVASGATLQVQGGLTVGTESMILAGAGFGSIGALDNLSGNNSFAGTVSITTATIGSDAGTLTLNGIVSGTGGLTKVGVGTLTLSATNTYTGTTTVSVGTLLVNGAQAGSPVSLNGGTLGGGGTVGAITSAAPGGTVNPGIPAAAGHLTSGAITWNSATTFAVDLDGTAPWTGYDQLTVNGLINLNNCNLGISLGYVAGPSDQYTVISNNGGSAVTGIFNGLPEGTLFTIGTDTFTITYLGGAGNDVVLTHIILVITARETVDADGDGLIDAIRMVSNYPLNDNFSGLTVTVAGYTVTGYDTGATANDTTFFVRLTEQVLPIYTGDTGATPSVRVTANTTLKINGTGQLLGVDAAGVLSVDKAQPVLLKADWTKGGNSNIGVASGDTVILTFSEPVKTIGTPASPYIGLPVTGDSWDTSVIPAQATAAVTLSIVLSGSNINLTPGGTYAVANLTPGSPTGVFINNGTPITDVVNLTALNQTFGTAVDLLPGTDFIGVVWSDGTITPKVWDLGYADLSSTFTTLTSAPPLVLIPVNDGFSRELFSMQVSISSPSGWTAASAAGLNQFQMKADASIPLDGVFELDLSTGPKTLAAAVYSGHSTQQFDLFFGTPSSIDIGVATPQTVTVTITVIKD